MELEKRQQVLSMGKTLLSLKVLCSYLNLQQYVLNKKSFKISFSVTILCV